MAARIIPHGCWSAADDAAPWPGRLSLHSPSQPASTASPVPGLAHAYRFSVFNALSYQIVLGSPMVLYAKHLGASATVLGIIAGMMPLLVIFQIPAAKHISRVGYKQFVFAGWGTRVLFIFLIFFRIFAIPAWIVLGIWFAVQIFSGLATPGDTGGVAYWAHAGGFIAGLALTLPVWLRRGGGGYWQATKGHPPHPPTAFQAARSNVPLVPRRRG